jgi:predicted transcriptional regulator of viral defense system
MCRETEVDHDSHGEVRFREIAALASRQHGFVARWQLAGLRVRRGAIDHWVKTGRLHVWYRGVYAVGHRAAPREGRWMAAVLAVGPGAVLSHRSAAALLGIRPSARAAIDVTVDRKLPSREGIDVHHARLDPDEVTVRDGIPVTTAARTLIDLAAVIRPRELANAVRQAEILRLPYPDLARYRGRRGTKSLPRRDPPPTRSQLEGRFIAFLDDNGLPPPLVNAPHNGIEPDIRWPQANVIVELDGFETHGTRPAFEDDRARDRALTVAGWRVVRVTWRQLHEEPRALAEDLRALLNAAACPRSPRSPRR